MKQPKSIEGKLQQYCAYQERSQQESRQKLAELGVWGEEAENIIVRLIEDNFLNEERFALAYAQGKFRMKQWGRKKISQGLKLKNVSDALIRKALRGLDPDEYEIALRRLLEKKGAQLTTTDPFKRRYQLVHFALSRGFEQELIADILQGDD